MKISYIIFLIFLFLSYDVKSQNAMYVNGNNVISYCYQPLISSLGVPQIYAINSNGTNNRKIIGTSFGLIHHNWSPDTMKFAAVGYVDGGNTTWSIYSFNSNGTNLVRLTNTNNVLDGEPVWSPDMSKISFTRLYPPQYTRRELWIMNSDGSNQHYIGIEGFGAKWSKDGTKFLYSSKKNNSNYDIYICDTNGTNEQRLTVTTVDEMYPEYSPSGTEIAYCAGLSSTTNDWEIYKMNANGTGVRKITNNNFYDYYPRWSPDGTMFVFESDRHEAGKWEVYIMDTSGTNVQRITYSPANVTAINPVWRQSSVTNIRKLNEYIPDNYKLFQNYPNPFNPSTKIKFRNKVTGIVSIKVYNVLGKEIAELVNDKLQAGEYEVDFDVSKCANGQVTNGVYFYSLKTGNYWSTRKMVLLK